MLRRLFLLSPLPLVPVPALFKGEKEPREPRCGTCKRGKNEMPFPSPQTALLNNDDLLIANTTTETALFSYTIPAGHLDGTHGVRVRIDGALKNDSGGDVYYILRLKLGATTMYQYRMGMGDAGASASPFVLSFEVMAKNSDAIQEAFLELKGAGFAAPTTGEGQLTTTAINGAGYGEATEDGTPDLDLVFSVEMDTAHADAWMLHRRSIVELL